MKPILEVAYLTSDHGSTLDKCPGCKICDRIAELRKSINPDPIVKYKCLLDKGKDLKVSEVRYLMDKGIDRKTIAKHMKTGIHEFNEIMENHGIFAVKKRRVVDEEMGNFTMTFEEYKDLKAQGKTNKEIAEIGGIKEGNLNYHIKKWKAENESEIKEAPLKSKELAPVLKGSSEYTELINNLKMKLNYSEQVVEEKDKLNKEYADKNMRLAADNVQLTAQNNQLLARIEKLEQDKLDLHAAADDMAREYLEKEEKLLIDLSLWEQQALTFKTENNRLNDTLKDVRQGADKHKGDAILFRSVLKAVL